MDDKRNYQEWDLKLIFLIFQIDKKLPFPIKKAKENGKKFYCC